MKTVGALALLLTVCLGHVGAQDLPKNRTSLKGLRGFAVVVNGVSEEAKKDGLTPEQLQTDTELRLRKTGLIVVNIEGQSASMVPVLYIKLLFLKNSTSLYAVRCDVELLQDVTADANGERVFAPTWSDGTVLTVGSNKIGEAVRGEIGDLVDKFLNAYLSVNPK